MHDEIPESYVEEQFIMDKSQTGQLSARIQVPIFEGIKENMAQRSWTVLTPVNIYTQEVPTEEVVKSEGWA